MRKIVGVAAIVITVTVGCFLRVSGTEDSRRLSIQLNARPQGVGYKAQCQDQDQDCLVEDIDYVLINQKSESGGVAANGYVSNGNQWNQYSIALDNESLVAGLELYMPKLDGGNLCEDQTYNPTEREREKCENSDGGCPFKYFEGRAILIPGYWNGIVWNPPDAGQYTLSCMSGITAKCRYWGYDPADAGLQNYYRACVHAGRAEYVPDSGMAYTHPDTKFDIYDSAGIQLRDTYWDFESRWDENGIICLSRSRFHACNLQLREAGAPFPQDCGDPEPKLDGGWDAGDKRTLIGVASYDNDGECPVK